MIGITLGQSLQINVIAYPPDPCNATLGFQNSSGTPVGQSASVQLEPGQSASLAIKGGTLVSSIGQRAEVLPVVVVNGGDSPNGCIASAEVFDNLLGVTSVLIPGEVGYQSPPALGMLGVTGLETVRLNVVAYPV